MDDNNDIMYDMGNVCMCIEDGRTVIYQGNAKLGNMLEITVLKYLHTMLMYTSMIHIIRRPVGQTRDLHQIHYGG